MESRGRLRGNLRERLLGSLKGRALGFLENCFRSQNIVLVSILNLNFEVVGKRR